MSPIPRPAPLDPADFRPVDPALADLGRLLFHDPLLSGNRNIACSTCHAHEHGSADGLSLPVGEGGRGLGPARDVGEGAGMVSARVPRHSPALFNLGHRSVTVLFHDGRLSVDAAEPSGFESPILEGREHDLPPGLDGIVAAQAMFPVAAATEMAGHASENDVAHGGLDVPERWALLAARVAAVPDYAAMLAAAYPDVEGPADVTFVHVANALADFIEAEWRSTDAAFDRWLAGEEGALTPAQRRGAALFYGEAGCASCHSGPLLTDGEHHALAMPQLGPGRTRDLHRRRLRPRPHERDRPARGRLPLPHAVAAQRRGHRALRPRGRLFEPRIRRAPPSRPGGGARGLRPARRPSCQGTTGSRRATSSPTTTRASAPA